MLVSCRAPHQALLLPLKLSTVEQRRLLLKGFPGSLKRDALAWGVNLSGTRIADLSPLAGLPLTHLSLYWTEVATLSPLARPPLRRLDIRFTLVTSVLPCRRMPLEELAFSASRIRRGLDSLRTVGTLKRINRWTAKTFWERWDGSRRPSH